MTWKWCNGVLSKLARINQLANILLSVLYIFYSGIDCIFYVWFIYDESQSSFVVVMKYTAVQKGVAAEKTLVVNTKKQFMIWENTTCVSINALHGEKKWTMPTGLCNLEHSFKKKKVAMTL